MKIIITITAGMTDSDIIKLIADMEPIKTLKFKHHIFRERGTIDLVFEEGE